MVCRAKYVDITPLQSVFRENARRSIGDGFFEKDIRFRVVIVTFYFYKHNNMCQIPYRENHECIIVCDKRFDICECDRPSSMVTFIMLWSVGSDCFIFYPIDNSLCMEIHVCDVVLISGGP